MSKERPVTRGDLEKIRFKLSEELAAMSAAQRSEYLKAADQVYSGLSRMAKIRVLKA